MLVYFLQCNWYRVSSFECTLHEYRVRFRSFPMYVKYSNIRHTEVLSDVYSFLLQFGNPVDARSNFFHGLCNTVNFIDHPRRAFYTRSHNVSVHLPRDFSAGRNSETTGMRSTFADKQFWHRIQIFAWERVSAYVRATLYTRNVNRPAACTQVTPLPRAWRERAVVPRREAALVWLTEFMGSTYRALTALYINNDTRTRGRSFPHAIPTGPFYAFLRCTFRLSLFTADKSPVNTTAPYFENCDAANARCIRRHTQKFPVVKPSLKIETKSFVFTVIFSSCSNFFCHEKFISLIVSDNHNGQGTMVYLH